MLRRRRQTQVRQRQIGWLPEKNNWDSLALHCREMSGLFGKEIGIVRGDLTKEDETDLNSCRRTLEELMLFSYRENADWQDIKNNSKPEPMM